MSSQGSFLPWKFQRIPKNGGTSSDSSGALDDPLAPPVVDVFPPEESKEEGENDWELLSDRVSLGSIGGAAILIPHGESVRSLTSLDNSSHNLSIPFRVQRTLSSSTIDSGEWTFNSSAGVLGVDYVEHVVLPSDTLQGLCLAYKISATRLRQVNHFSGTSLLLAPKKLIIPLTKKNLRTGFIRVQDKDSRDYKLHALLAELPSLKEAEATAYLELSDWDLEEALRSARDDGEWEREVQDDRDGRSGDICITLKMGGGFRTKGAGLLKKTSSPTTAASTKSVATIYEGIPAVATKDVRPHDLYHAAPEHNEFGVEMKPIVPKSEK